MKQTSTYDTYILAIWPHPDDVEVGAWWALIKSAGQGKKNVILDLTPSQLSTHGDVETRLAEAQEAAKILGVTERKNMMFEDGSICDNIEWRKKLAREIRLHKPEIIMMPWKEDRHPDHECASQLIKNAVFYAGLRKMDLDGLAPHKPRLLVYYMIRQAFDPDLIIPLTVEEYETKMRAFGAYGSQQKTNDRGHEYVRSRHIMHGHEIGVHYGEWYRMYSHGIGVDSFDDVKNGFF